MICCCCGATLQAGLATWHWECKACGYEAADFGPDINHRERHALVDESAREEGLKQLRGGNFRALVEVLKCRIPSGQKVLDVGAAHGWFVQVASQCYDVIGIEPDSAVCQAAQRQGIPLIEGYFPDALSAQDQFAAIVFNDVFEHIPDVAGGLEACRAHLGSQGLLVLNLPSKAGFFYKLSRIMQRCGLPGSFERMWQKGLPSPHVHYFDENSLSLLVAHHGFKPVYLGYLPSVQASGLYARITYIGRPSRLVACLIWVGIMLCIPLLRMFKSDIMVVVAQKKLVI
ncbi:MAG: class I SAM-dependent methyltransferase [Pseudomonas sp.]|uniref:class I SAM-dependent methyltransferase n=1 Tax=Pseudomonas sp. TaxID=306 RepID=UPI003390F354